MNNFAAATIEGFVTQDPQLKKTKTGKSVCTFSIAVNHYSKTEDPPRVSFIEVETWERIAEMCSNNVKKGKRLMIIGNLRQDRWENEEGKARSRIKIVGNEIRFLESKLKQEEAAKEQPQAQL
ncbi:MAG: single-stranded DNA-binding protein [Spirochaetota bacterium]